MRIRLAGSLLLAVMFSGAARAQTDSVPLTRLPVGAEVRVWMPDPPLQKWRLIYTGLTPSPTGSSANFEERHNWARVDDFRPTVPVAEIERLEVFNGKKQSGFYFFKSTLAGAAIGTSLGAILGAALGGGIRNPADNGPGIVVLFGVLGFGTGSVAGAIAGADGQTVWAPVNLRR